MAKKSINSKKNQRETQLQKVKPSLLRKFILIFGLILLGIILLVILINVFTDSGKIENKRMGGSFNASQYPLVINQTKYPELAAVEKDLSGKYELLLQNFYEKFYQGEEFECESGPEISTLKFNFLQPKQDLYVISLVKKTPHEVRG